MTNGRRNDEAQMAKRRTSSIRSRVLRVRMDDGTELDCKPGDVPCCPPLKTSVYVNTPTWTRRRAKEAENGVDVRGQCAHACCKRKVRRDDRASGRGFFGFICACDPVAKSNAEVTLRYFSKAILPPRSLRS